LRLTYNELSIMDVLWREDRPLLSTEIVELCTEKEWKPSSIHILINSLLEKDAIKIGGFVKTGKHYSRTFVPSLSQEDFIVYIMTSSNLSETVVKGVVTKLIEKTPMSEESLCDIEQCVKVARQR